MRRLLTILAVCCLSLLAALPLAAQPAPPGVAGEWLGALDVGAIKLRLALHIETKSGGGLATALDSLDQGTKVPVDETLFENGRLRLALKMIGASYEGMLSADGATLQGTWSQGGRQLPLTFQRQEKAAALRRPQEPKGPFPYRSLDVSFRSGAGNVELAGTLLLPAGQGPFPAVAFITGSGPQDRDETLMGHRPFLVIADALARRGIASLRWDDRGTAKSGGDYLGSTEEDSMADARAAVAFLRSRPEVSRSAVGIVGHSEGGLIGPMAAAADPGVSFLVLLAPPGVPLRALLERQARDILRVQGVEPRLIDRTAAAQAEDLAMIADPAIPDGELRARLKTLAATRRSQLTAAERASLKMDDGNAVEQSIQMAASPWFRSLVRQDPAVYLRKVRVPVLALFGGKDLQVEPQANLEAVRAALAANPDHQERILPGLNHLFQHAGTGAVDEYGTIEETFAPEALATIGDWIAARFPKRPTAAR